MLLIHGGRDHCRNWDWVAERFRDRFHIIALDLRGHGDSAWSPDFDYTMTSQVVDLAELIHQLDLAPLTMIGHSFGGAIALRYAGIYPEHFEKLVAIEGLGLMPAEMQTLAARPIEERMREWIERQRALKQRHPRRYASLHDAAARMQEANAHLNADQVRHLTLHGLRENADGTFSWKFDNHIRALYPIDITPEQRQTMWSRISCPTLLVYGSDSWASNPEVDGRAAHFPNAHVVTFEGAGHWVHHDRLDAFVAEVERFLA
jgi:pimeloyl-ACP methyl ester carboxylesterase